MPGDFEDLFDDEVSLTRSGTLEILPGGWGLLRQAGSNPRRRNIYVAQGQIAQLGLKPGDTIMGRVRPPKETEKHPVLAYVDAVNGRRLRDN